MKQHTSNSSSSCCCAKPSGFVLAVRRSLVVGLILSTLLLMAAQWQLHHLHRAMRHQEASLLKVRSVFVFTHHNQGPAGSDSSSSSSSSHSAHGGSDAAFSSYHGSKTGLTDSSSRSQQGSSGSNGGGGDDTQQAAQAHQPPPVDQDAVDSSSLSSSAGRKGGTFLAHLSEDSKQRQQQQRPQQRPQLQQPTKQQPAKQPDSQSSMASLKTAVASSSQASSTSTTASNAALAEAKSLLAPVLTATARAKSDPVYRKKLEEAASKPINIAVMSSLFWALPVSHTQGCKVDGIPLDCHIQSGGTEEFLKKADALYYHVPSFGGKPRAKAFPHQLRIAMSLESAAYYANLDNPNFMCQFDAEMTYRTCAQVTNWYSLESHHKLFEKPPVPFEEKLHAIAYVNSNCGAQSGRSEIMRKLIAMGDKAKVPVHALGRCDNNTPWPPGRPNKIEVMRKYKFCVAMENSIRQDYMTEKMWDALAAGCVPIYLGSNNAPQIIPDSKGVVMYDASGKTGHASTPEQLDAVLHEIGSDKPRYEAMVAWKQTKPEEQPSEIFRYLWSQRATTGECFLCQFLARHRAEPQEQYTTCLFNKDWMQSAGQPFVPLEETKCRAEKAATAKAATV